MKVISYNGIEKKIDKIAELGGFDPDTQEELESFIEKAVFDAEPIVRCKDCKHRPIPNGNNHPLTPKPSEFEWDYVCPYLCDDEYYNLMPEDNDYCSRGERRKDDDSDTDSDDI